MKSKEILPTQERRMIPEDWKGNKEKLLGTKGGVPNQPLLSKDYIYRMNKAFLYLEKEREKIDNYLALGYGIEGPVPDVGDDEEDEESSTNE